MNDLFSSTYFMHRWIFRQHFLRAVITTLVIIVGLIKFFITYSLYLHYCHQYYHYHLRHNHHHSPRHYHYYYQNDYHYYTRYIIIITFLVIITRIHTISSSLHSSLPSLSLLSSLISSSLLPSSHHHHQSCMFPHHIGSLERLNLL